MSLLSKQTVKSILEKDKERRAEFGKPPLAAGEHMMTLSGLELKNSKNTNDAMLVMELSADADHAPLQEQYMLSGKGQETGLNKIVTFMANAFKHEMEEAEDEKALLAQLMKFKGKKFKGAVKIQEQLYTFTDSEQKEQATITKRPKLWFCSTADDTNFKVNIAKAVQPLSAEDKQKYMEWKKAHPAQGEYASEASNTTLNETEESPLPF
jgi:hypothetical protein